MDSWITHTHTHAHTLTHTHKTQSTTDKPARRKTISNQKRFEESAERVKKQLDPLWEMDTCARAHARFLSVLPLFTILSFCSSLSVR